MNANVSIYQDSVKDSSGILTSESNEIGSLKIIMPDKLNQLAARSSYICHIDDFVKGNKDYYGFDIQSDREVDIHDPSYLVYPVSPELNPGCL